MNEKEAISRLKQGDISGLDELVVRYQVLAMRTAFLITHDRYMAEDVVQISFISVFEHAQQFDLERPFVKWFGRIVVNNALKATMQQKRRISLDEMSNEKDSSFQRFLIAEDSTPENLILKAETFEEIQDALSKLSPHQRYVLVSHYYLEVKESDIAIELGCPPGTIRWRIYSARQRLRNLLKKNLVRFINE